MKFLQRQSRERDPSILERELELEKEDSMAREWGFSVKLQEGLPKYVFNFARVEYGEFIDRIPLVPRWSPLAVLWALPMVPILSVIGLIASYIPENQYSVTGKYILRYDD